jgi:hypothetical protein
MVRRHLGRVRDKIRRVNLDFVPGPHWLRSCEIRSGHVNGGVSSDTGIRVAKTQHIPLRSGVLSDTMKRNLKVSRVKPFAGKVLT